MSIALPSNNNELNALQTKKTELQAQLAALANDEKGLIEVIKQQHWWFFTDKKDVIFDSHMGYFWPNLSNVKLQNVESQVPVGGSLASCIDFKKIKVDKNYTLGGMKKWQYSENLEWLIEQVATSDNTPFDNIDIWLANSDSEPYANAFNTMAKAISLEKYDERYALPYNDTFTHLDFFKQNTNFTPLEKAQKILDLFLAQNWQPIFTNVDHYVIYQKLQQRPQLLKALSDLEPTLAQAIEHEKTQKQPLSGQFNHHADLKPYNLTTIDASSLQYAHALHQWTNNLLNKLDDFSQQHSDLISTATTLHQRLHSDTDINENVGDDLAILAERDDYLQNALNFGLDAVRSKLINAQQQGLQLQQQLTNSALSHSLLADLASIQHAPRPSFAFVAEYTAHLVLEQVQKLEWLQTHQHDLEKLVDSHHTWLNAFDTFTSKDYNDFLQAAKREHIDTPLAQQWYNEWRQHRRTLEAQLLPLYQLALSNQCPLDTANAVLNILQHHQHAVDNFYKKERLATHQRHAFSSNGTQQEQYDTRLQLFKLSSTFQAQLESLLFALPQVAIRISLLRWSEVITQQHFSGMSVQTDSVLANHQHSDIWQTISQELRSLQQRTLETFIQDAEHFGQARKQRDDEFNSLVFRMRKELQKP